MEAKICMDCGKVVEGYNERHVDYLMSQHKLACKRKGKEKGDEDGKGAN